MYLVYYNADLIIYKYYAKILIDNKQTICLFIYINDIIYINNLNR